MTQQPNTSLYLQATVDDVGTLAKKLAQLSQQLSEVERALLMERIKRSLNNSEVTADAPVAADPAVFGAWLNEILADGSRWYPEKAQ